MQIRCKNCQKEYHLDARLLSPSGTPVRCTNCDTVFKAYPPQDGADISAPPRHPASGGGVARRASATSFHPTITGPTNTSRPIPPIKPVSSQRTTQPPPPMTKTATSQPVMARPIVTTQSPQKSPTSPNRAQTDPQRDSFLNGQTLRADSAASTPQPPPQHDVATGAVPQTDTPAPTSNTAHFNTDQLGQMPSDGPDLSGVPGAPQRHWNTETEASHTVPRESSSTVTETDSGVSPAPSNVGKWVLIVSVAILFVGGGTWVALFKKDAIIHHLGMAQDSKNEARQQALALQAKEHFLLDSTPDFQRAERTWLQALDIDPTNGKIAAELAIMYGVWAQYMMDTLLDSDTRDTSSSVTRDGYNARLGDGERIATQALKSTPTSSLAHLAMADIKRQQGDLDAAHDHLAKGKGPDTMAEASYLRALLAIDESRDAKEIIGMLRATVSAAPLLRAYYRMARVQAAMNDIHEARQTLDTVLELNAKHTHALALKRQLDDGHPIALRFPDPQGDDADDSAEDMTISEADVAEHPPSPKTASSSGRHSKEEERDAARHETVEQLLINAANAQKNGHTSEALRLFETVLQRSPGNIDALNGVAYVHLDRKAHGQAIRHFEQILSTNRNFGPAIIGMAQTFKSQGNTRAALQWFETYLEVLPGGRHAGMARRNADQLGAAPTSDTNLPTAPSDTSSSSQDSPVPAPTTPDDAPDTPAPAPSSGSSPFPTAAPVAPPSS